MKRKKGSIGDVVLTLLTILASAIIVYAYFSVMELVSINEEVKQISRKYMLEMEAKGYLEADSATRVKQQLQDIGVTNVNLYGSSFNDVGYGSPIYLKISCNIPYENIVIGGDLLEIFFEDAEFLINKDLMSTAKN